MIRTSLLYVYVILLKPAGYLWVEVLVIMAEMQKGKTSNDNTFYTSVCNTLAKILLVKVHHMLRGKSKGRKVYSIFGGLGGMGLQSLKAQVWTQKEEKNWEK